MGTACSLTCIDTQTYRDITFLQIKIVMTAVFRYSAYDKKWRKWRNTACKREHNLVMIDRARIPELCKGQLRRRLTIVQVRKNWGLGSRSATGAGISIDTFGKKCDRVLWSWQPPQHATRRLQCLVLASSASFQEFCALWNLKFFETFHRHATKKMAPNDLPSWIQQFGVLM